MVADAPRLAHPGGGQDHLGRFVEVDLAGFVARYRQMQIREGDRILAARQQGQRFIVVVGAHLVAAGVDVRRLDGQRAVHPYREPVVPAQAAFGLDLPQQIQQLLRPPDGEARDHHVAAAVERVLQHPRQVRGIVRARAVQPVAVGRFDDHRVGRGRCLRIADQRPVHVAKIAGKQQPLRFAVFRHRDVDAGRAQQMSRIGKADLHAVEQVDVRAVAARDKLPDRALRVLGRVQRDVFVAAAALCFAVTPFCLELLDVRAVQQHDPAQRRRRARGIDLAGIAVLHQLRQTAGMVDVCVRQQHGVQFAGRDGQRRVLIDVQPLLHAAVDQDAAPRRLQQHTRAGDFVRRPKEGQFHRYFAPFTVDDTTLWQKVHEQTVKIRHKMIRSGHRSVIFSGYAIR